jgi:flagellar assembly protein FliH
MIRDASMLQADPVMDTAVADPRAWNAPEFDGVQLLPGHRRPTEQQREAQRRQFSEAEAAGRAAGLAAAKQEIDTRLRALDSQARSLGAALDALARPLSHVDDEIHEQIAMLSVRIARALLRRELRTDPTQIIGIVRETVALLPASARGVRVVLHPEDAAQVRERLVTAGPESAWSIVDDPVLTRGDCRVQTDYAQVDARIETRLHEILSSLIGEDRLRSREGDSA